MAHTASSQMSAPARAGPAHKPHRPDAVKYHDTISIFHHAMNFRMRLMEHHVSIRRSPATTLDLDKTIAYEFDKHGSSCGLDVPKKLFVCCIHLRKCVGGC